MFKKLSTFFLSLFVLSGTGIALASSLAKAEPTIVFADGDEDEPQTPDISGYTYTETDGEHMNEVLRVYEDPSLAPAVKRRFCAPSGLVITLSLSDELLDIWFALFDSVQANYTYQVPVIQYQTFGSTVYSSSDPTYGDSGQSFEERRALIKDRFKWFTDGYVLFEAKELVVGTTINVVYDAEMYTDNPASDDPNDRLTYIFRFIGETVSLDPYDEFDFITLRANYIERSNEFESNDKRIAIDCEVIPGFFNDGTWWLDSNDDCYNDFGFMTDETYKAWDSIKEDEAWLCKFDLDLFAFDTIPLGSFINENHRIDRIELTNYPDQVLPIKAKLSFVSGGRTYTYYSKTFEIGNPNICVLVDGYQDRSAVEVNSVHTYTFNVDVIKITEDYGFSADVYADPVRLHDLKNGYELFDNPVLPERGEVNKYYYIPSAHEIELHNQGRDEEIFDSYAEGTYYIWNAETSAFESWGYGDWDHEQYQFLLLETYYFPGEGVEFDLDTLLSSSVAFPFVGEYRFSMRFMGGGIDCWFSFDTEGQRLYVVEPFEGNEEIILNVPDEVNLIQGAGEIQVVPTVSGIVNNSVHYYYDYEISKEGVADVDQALDGVLTLNPITHGYIDLTIYVESDVFSKISKTVSVRVLDSVFGVSKVVVPNGFHYAGKDLTASVAVRGFTNIQNLDIDWKVVGKDGKDLATSKYAIHSDATMTINKAPSNDYKITASYEGIDLGTIKVQVRQININEFVRQNIWWVVLITVSFVFVVLFLNKIMHTGLTTVQAIDRVYGVFCSCISDDKLTMSELKTIRREIKKCLHRCEDLNIEALNQYEKAIRYLRKSLVDTNNLLNKWETISVEDKSAFTEKLNLDLSKALNVAREIENAKELIEKYHVNANKKNFETLTDEGKPNKKNK